MLIDAVIFDFDGVIGKTMEDNYVAWSNACDKFDINLKKDEYYLLEGLNVNGVAKILLEKNGKSISHIEDMVHHKEQYYLKNNRFSLYPGIKDLLEYLSSFVKLSLVTGASRSRLNATLPIGFLDYFTYIVSGDQNIDPKPSPAPYLAAISGLNVDNDKAIVIENAPLGIQSAKNAGLYCLAVTSTLKEKYLNDADVVLKDMHEINAWLKLTVKKNRD